MKYVIIIGTLNTNIIQDKMRIWNEDIANIPLVLHMGSTLVVITVMGLARAYSIYSQLPSTTLY